MREVILCTIIISSACFDGPQIAPPSTRVARNAVPEDASDILVEVGNVEISAQDLQQYYAELGAYGQRRFQGEEGQKKLLEMLVDLAAVRQMSEKSGISREDPRVIWHLVEALAEQALREDFERHIESQAMADEPQQLQELWAKDALPREPEMRSVRALRFDNWGAAMQAFDARAKGATLESLGQVFETVAEPQDNAKYPGFHRVLFAPELEPGDPLAQPVYVAGEIWVAELSQVVAEKRPEFTDPTVQAKLRELFYQPLRTARVQSLLGELAQRYP